MLPLHHVAVIDRGADLSLLSQFPAEQAILFAPLTGLEVISVPRIEFGVIVVQLRLSCNLSDATIEQCVSASHAHITHIAS